MERANNALAVVADITWMYNPEYEVYNRLFDIIPREVILHGIFSTEQVPDWEYNILDIGRVMYDTSPDYQKYNYSEFIDDLNDVIELFSINFSEILSDSVDPGVYEIVGWLDRYSVILVDKYRALSCIRNDIGSYERDCYNIFKNNRRVIEGLVYLFNSHICSIMKQDSL